MFKHLPFEICSVKDMFQSIMSEMVEDIGGVEAIVDDLLIQGDNESQHDACFTKVLE